MTDRKNETERRERATEESATDKEIDAQLDAEDRRQTESATDASQATVPKVGKNQVGSGGSGKPLH